MPVYRISYTVLDDEHQNEVLDLFNSGLSGIGRENMFNLRQNEWIISYCGKEKALMERFDYMKDYLEVFTSEIFKDHFMFYIQKNKQDDYFKWLSNKVHIRCVEHIKSSGYTV